MSNSRNIARFDSVGGASGDMILSAFLDLGVNSKDLISTLKQLDIENFELIPRKVEQNGLHGTGLEIKIDQHGNHHHRTFHDIQDILEKSGIEAKVKDTSLQVFRKLAEAEASVHNTTPDKVTFHEVGAADSIIDIVGSCFCLESLKIESVTVGPLPAGRGTIPAAHGLLPVPVPATCLLLRNHQIIQTEETTELVTPTGAALLATWEELLPPADCAATVSKTGHGFGSKKLSARPNLLRISLLSASKKVHETSDYCIVLESNIDDTIPELLGSLASRLFEAGALEVFFTAAQMKKHRPGTLLSVLARPEDQACIKELIFRETTTFGIREYGVSRTTLARRSHAVQTRYGPVKIKIGALHGEDVTWSPEYEDCVRIAREQQTPVRKVYEAALRAHPDKLEEIKKH